MIVTIMSDASVCPKTGAAGWGVYIKSNRGFFEGGGTYKTSVVSVSTAEAMALANAIYIAFHARLAAEGDRLVLQTDNMFTVRAVKNEYDRGNSHLVKYANKIRQKAKLHKCEFDIRHVKAHAPELGKRNFANEICDYHAKKAMRSQRSQIIGALQ